MMAIGTGASLLYTDDMGENWHVKYKPAGVSRFVTFNAIFFVDSSIGYIVGNQSVILKTNNGGMSWVDISLEDNQAILDVFFLSESIGVITKTESIWKTVNGGQSWDSVTANGPLYNPKYLHFINDSTGFLANNWDSVYYKTIDAGNSWQQADINPIIENFIVTAVQYLNQDTGFVSGSVNTSSSSDHYILKTIDGGESFMQVSNHPSVASHKLWFYDDSIGFSVGQQYAWDVIQRTIDGGNTWQDGIMNDYSIRDLNSFVYSIEGVAMCVGDYGQIFTSIDVGDNWYRTNETVCEGRIDVAQIVNDSVIYIGTTPHGGGGVPSGSIYKSNDAGYTWNRVLRRIPFTSICFLNESYGFTCGPSNGNVYKTINGGSTWQTIEIDTYNFDSYCVYFINEQVGFVSGEENWAEIYKTVDGGVNWYKTDSYSHQVYDKITFIEFINDSVGFAIGEYWPAEALLLRTVDQGETWTTDTLGFPYALKKVHFVNSDIGFLLTYNNIILKTTDGGDNWYEVPSGVEGWANFSDIDFPTDQIGYITLEDNETQVIKTTDGGEIWFPIEFPCTATPTTVSFFSEDEGLVMGDGGMIFKTYSGGIVDVPEFPEDITNEANLICYPNPVKDILNINLNVKDDNYPERLIIYDIFGRKIKDLKNRVVQNTIELDVSYWEVGVYFVVSVSKGEIISRGKFVKIQ